jgi:hypothetical protein
MGGAAEVNKIELKYKDQGVYFYPSIAFPRQVIVEIIHECKSRRIRLHAIEAFLSYDRVKGIQPIMDYSFDIPLTHSLDDGYTDALRRLEEHTAELMYEIYIDLPDLPVKLNKNGVERLVRAFAVRLRSIAIQGVCVDTYREQMPDGLVAWVIAFRGSRDVRIPVFTIKFAERLNFNRPTVVYEYGGLVNSFNVDPMTRSRCIELARILSSESMAEVDGSVQSAPLLATSPLQILNRTFDLILWCEPRSFEV